MLPDIAHRRARHPEQQSWEHQSDHCDCLGVDVHSVAATSAEIHTKTHFCTLLQGRTHTQGDPRVTSQRAEEGRTGLVK